MTDAADGSQAATTKRFQVKVCGIRSVAEARAAVTAGFDAIGLNFFEKSRRCVSIAEAQRIAEAVRGEVSLVGLFVNSGPAEVQNTHQVIGLDFVQLHGDEDVSQWQSLQLPHLIRAFRWPAATKSEADFIDRWTNASPMGLIHGYLVDANVRGLFGGTGAVTDWASLRPRPPCFASSQLILAGGLRPDNVAAAIESARCDAVDTAGGVEAADGTKDPRLMEQFVAAAQRGFASLRQFWG